MGARGGGGDTERKGYGGSWSSAEQRASSSVQLQKSWRQFRKSSKPHVNVVHLLRTCMQKKKKKSLFWLICTCIVSYFRSFLLFFLGQYNFFFHQSNFVFCSLNEPLGLPVKVIQRTLFHLSPMFYESICSNHFFIVCCLLFSVIISVINNPAWKFLWTIFSMRCNQSQIKDTFSLQHL